MENIINSLPFKENLSPEAHSSTPILLYVSSLLNAAPEEIRSAIASFNQSIDYFIKNGQQFQYITSEENSPMSYDDLTLLETLVTKSKQEIEARNANTNIEKARVIEYLVSHELQTIVHWDDEDFYSSCDKSLIQALKEKRGSCCHFAVLTQYLHLRNNMYSDLIFSNVNVEDPSQEKIYHIFNLLFLDDDGKNWTFVDTMWEKAYLRIRERNRFSFVSLEDIQNDPDDIDHAHSHITQNLSDTSTVSFDMDDVDKKLGYLNKLRLFQYSYFIGYYIVNNEIENVKRMFNPKDVSMQNLLNKNQMIQFVGFISYISAIELGQTGLTSGIQKPDETAIIQCLDTYLKAILPVLYLTFFEGRIRAMKPAALENYDDSNNYASSLFQITKGSNKSIGICFNDMIDKAYISIDFTKFNDFPYVQSMNRMQFEDVFGKITPSTSLPREKENCEISN